MIVAHYIIAYTKNNKINQDIKISLQTVLPSMANYIALKS